MTNHVEGPEAARRERERLEATLANPERIVREHERRVITGVGTSTWYRWMAEGIAPQPIRLGPRIRGWKLGDLLTFIELRRSQGGAS